MEFTKDQNRSFLLYFVLGIAGIVAALANMIWFAWIITPLMIGILIVLYRDLKKHSMKIMEPSLEND